MRHLGRLSQLSHFARYIAYLQTHPEVSMGLHYHAFQHALEVWLQQYHHLWYQLILLTYQLLL